MSDGAGSSRTHPSAEQDAQASIDTSSAGGSETGLKPFFLTSNAFHIGGVVLSGVALVTGEILNPGVGFPVAVGVLSMLGLVGSPPANAPPIVLRTIRGSVLKGGMKQGILIKSLFGVALFYRGFSTSLSDSGSFDITSLALGAALFSTAIGTAVAAYTLTKRLE